MHPSEEAQIYVHDLDLFMNRCGTSGSPQFPLHLSTCIEAPETSANSRSWGDFVVDAGIALASVGE